MKIDLTPLFSVIMRSSVLFFSDMLSCSISSFLKSIPMAAQWHGGFSAVPCVTAFLHKLVCVLQCAGFLSPLRGLRRFPVFIGFRNVDINTSSWIGEEDFSRHSTSPTSSKGDCPLPFDATYSGGPRWHFVKGLRIPGYAPVQWRSIEAANPKSIKFYCLSHPLPVGRFYWQIHLPPSWEISTFPKPKVGCLIEVLGPTSFVSVLLHAC